jgi:hypothetical protein
MEGVTAVSGGCLYQPAFLLDEKNIPPFRHGTVGESDIQPFQDQTILHPPERRVQKKRTGASENTEFKSSGVEPFGDLKPEIRMH